MAFIVFIHITIPCKQVHNLANAFISKPNENSSDEDLCRSHRKFPTTPSPYDLMSLDTCRKWLPEIRKLSNPNLLIRLVVMVFDSIKDLEKFSLALVARTVFE